MWFKKPEKRWVLQKQYAVLQREPEAQLLITSSTTSMHLLSMLSLPIAMSEASTPEGRFMTEKQDCRAMDPQGTWV